MIPLNQQPYEKLDRREDGSVEIVDVWKTIQGEGPFSGVPAVFVRLAGCNLRCPSCDTDYTTNRRRVTPVELADEVTKVGKWGDVGAPLVVLTGGEPFRQNIQALFVELAAREYRVQVETNGTLAPEFDDFPYLSPSLSVVVSPKARVVHERMDSYAVAFKYVLDADHVDPKDGLPTSVLENLTRPARPNRRLRVTNQVYLQPMDTGDPEKNMRNQDAVIQSCLKFGYRLSLQTHKLVGLP